MAYTGRAISNYQSHNPMKKYICLIFAAIIPLVISSQIKSTTEEEYIKNIQRSYDKYKRKIEKQYSDYLRDVWEKYNAYQPIAFPDKDIQPVIREKNDTIAIKEIHIKGKSFIDIKQHSKPIDIIHNKPIIDNNVDNVTTVSLYNTELAVHYPKILPALKSVSNNDIADTWEQLLDGRFGNTINDCLKFRQDLSLCDWAYVNLLNNVSKSIYSTSDNEAALLFACLLDMSDFDMRISRSNDYIAVLIACAHEVYGYTYLLIDGKRFYPFMAKDKLDNIYICNVPTQNKKSLSLFIDTEQRFDESSVNEKSITSYYGTTLNITVPVNKNILDFYSSYPTSRINGDDMTRWAMYAQTPIETITREPLYNQLQKYINGKSQIEAANILLNFVQTGFKYKYDEEVWGADRAFFAEETLYYPYCDCEDRSILFSHLIRDLLGLDVALVYAPGHLYAAVNFTESTTGAYILVDNKKFTVCEPTCTNGAPVGWSAVKNDTAEINLIVLNKIKYALF